MKSGFECGDKKDNSRTRRQPLVHPWTIRQSWAQEEEGEKMGEDTPRRSCILLVESVDY